MSYQLNQKLADLIPYEPIAGTYRIRLDANESYAELPQEIKQKLADAVMSLPLNRYPDPLAQSVDQAFATLYNLNPDCVTAGNGSDELISVITSCFLESGDTIVTLDNDFSMYAFYGSLYELNVQVCPKNPDLTIDVDRLISFCKSCHAKALVFSNPCNPTSLGLCRDQIRRLLDALDCLVILDEAYMDFWTESMLPEITGYDNCIILKTCSKAIGLAAVRLGFAVAGATITRALRAAKSPYNTDSISQAIGTVVLAEKEYLQAMAQALTRSARALYDGMTALQADNPTILTQIYTPCTNFVYIKTDYFSEIYTALLAHSIAIRKFNGYLRITAGTQAENAALLQAMQEIVSQLTEKERLA